MCPALEKKSRRAAARRFRAARLALLAVVAALPVTLAFDAGAGEMQGELLFTVKCGRCHNPLRVALGLFKGSSARSLDELAGAANFGHFMKGDEDRRAILLYLQQVADEQQ